MQIPLRCPICEQNLSDAEGLLITHDAFGDIIVWHMVPEDCQNADTHDRAVFHEAIRNTSHPTMLPGNVNSAHRCGNAGYTKLTFTTRG